MTITDLRSYKDAKRLLLITPSSGSRHRVNSINCLFNNVQKPEIIVTKHYMRVPILYDSQRSEPEGY